MSKLKFVEASFHYEGSDALIFENLNLELDTAWKSAIVARNGKGKTTLLQLMAGKLELTRGTFQKDVETAYFPLEISDPTIQVLDLMKQEIGPYLACEQIMADFLQGKTSEENYYEALSTYLELGGYELEANIKRECHHLLLKEETLYRPYKSLSGGEQTKVQIIILFLKAEAFILLDEPTNHLDLEGIQHLSAYLTRKSGYVIVSHHRHFLNACIDHVIALEKENVVIRQGNFAQYDADYQDRKNLENKQRDKAEKEISRLQKTAREKRDWSNATEKKKIGAGDKGFVSAQARRIMQRAQHAERRRDAEIQEKKAMINYQEHVPYLKFEQQQDVKELLRVTNLAIGYDRPLSQNISFALATGDRLAIKGPNGSGKTTLIKTLLEKMPPLEGLIKKDGRAKISYSAQMPHYQQGMLKAILQEEGLEESRFRSILGALSCHREIFDRDLSTFSLGEQKKVDLAFSLANPSHLLIWDEPLNGLDIMSRQAIEEAVLNYGPTLIFIEHDQEFSRRIATKEIQL